MAWDAQFERTLLLVLLDAVRRQFNARTFLAFELLVLDELPTATVTQLTGLSRNAAYKARRRVLQRLAQIAGTYAEDGQLPAAIRQAMQEGPSEHIERSLGTRIKQTMQSR